MQLTDTQLSNFIGRIKLKRDNMSKYRDQANNLKEKLGEKIKSDTSTGVKVSRFLIAGSWKKHTILRATGDNPIDIDLVLFITGDDSLRSDINKLHDFVVKYLEQIYPTKDIFRDVDAEGKTKAITIKFVGTGLHVDIVPVVPLETPEGYVWQPERGGGGRYHTSVDGQLEANLECRRQNASYTSIVRAIKWWRNEQELELLTSFTIELIIAHLDATEGISNSIEDGIIRFFRFLSDADFPEITFPLAINEVPSHTNPIFIADPTNNENNAASKMTKDAWEEVVGKALEAYETLHYARAKGTSGGTVDEWKEVFGPSFNID